MATLRAIRARIKGIRNTQQITRAMKMVAAAKMRRAQERMFSARPYAAEIKEMIQGLIRNVEDARSPLLQVRPVERLTLVVVTADRGLCGAFNHNVIRRAEEEVRAAGDIDVSLVCVGRKGYDYFRKRNYTIANSYVNIFNNLNFQHAHQIAEFLMREFIEARTDAVRLVFNEFKNVVQQNLIVEGLLPLQPESFEDIPQVDYIYEPSREELLEALLPRYVKTRVWRALLESNASEQAARMVAMDNATENAEDLIRRLTLQYNKARQESITKEILDIVGGAEALRKASG
ncbi:MAG: ATP synthase F1 subunit gamma [Calditrichaeota bacterium]|nr:MAG: ATP synthase F1 subunit gamma [Calditrichota bacterium]